MLDGIRCTGVLQIRCAAIAFGAAMIDGVAVIMVAGVGANASSS